MLTGYFSLLKKNYNNGPVDDFVPHYQEISALAGTDTENFLIGGDRRVQALQIVRRENGSIIHQQRTLFPGDVLRKGKIYVGEKRRKSKLFRKTKVVTEKYMLCTDDADREILIPFDQKGLFYTLTTTSGGANRPVLQMSEIVNKKCFPCIVRLVYGRIPNTPCSFTGTLRLERADLEQSVVAATLLNTKNILLEIPTSCDLQFNVVVSNDDLIRMPTYHQALDLCNEKGSIYMRNIKVCYKITSDSHNEPPSDLQMEDEIATKLVQYRQRISTQISIGTDASEDNSQGSDSRADRTSDYVDMQSVESDSVDENPHGLSLFSTEIDSNDESPFPCACPNQFSNPHYMESQISVEHKCLLVEMKIDEDFTCQPDEPPGIIQKLIQEAAPKPCSGSGGSFDSGIQMEPDGQGGRRSSTQVFSEAAQHFDDDSTYDIPHLPSRRVSAPPGCNILPPTSEKSAEHAREAFNRRPSIFPPPLPTTKEDLSPIEFAIEELDSEEEAMEPIYQNIEGSYSKMEDLFRYGDGSLRTQASSRCSSTRDSGHLSDECVPGRSSKNFDRDRLSPNIFQTIPIGEIPDLPRSRRNSISPVADNNTNSSLPIPALPMSKDSLKDNKCDSSSLSTKDPSSGENLKTDSNEENNNLNKSTGVDTEINIDNFTEVLQLTETGDQDVFYEDSLETEHSNEKQCPPNRTSEIVDKDRNYSISSLRSLDISDDNLENCDVSDQTPRQEEKKVYKRCRPKIKSEEKRSRQSKDISKMTVQELAVEFRRVGIKEQTIELVISENLNGLTLLGKYQEHDTIGAFLPTAGLIDQQKISLFIQGCKY